MPAEPPRGAPIGPPLPGLYDDPSTAIPGLWVPSLLFANAFAVFWLVRSFSLMNPAWLVPLRRLLPSACTRSTGGGGSAGDCGGRAGAARAGGLDSSMLAEFAEPAGSAGGCAHARACDAQGRGQRSKAPLCRLLSPPPMGCWCMCMCMPAA